MVEATFTPYFRVFLEHRSSALLVYNAVHGSYPYRAKTNDGVIKHISEILSIISCGFQQHVPKEDGGQFGRLIPNVVSVKAFREAIKATHELQGPRQATYAGVPRREVLASWPA